MDDSRWLFYEPGHDRRRPIKEVVREGGSLVVGHAKVEEPSGHLVRDTGRQSNRRSQAAGPRQANWESCLSHDKRHRQEKREESPRTPPSKGRSY